MKLSPGNRVICETVPSTQWLTPSALALITLSCVLLHEKCTLRVQVINLDNYFGELWWQERRNRVDTEIQCDSPGNSLAAGIEHSPDDAQLIGKRLD